jgi:phosphoglycerate dehydrogenase-like enzyme
MKPNAVLINTGRGKSVDTKALYEALKGRQIRGAGLDLVDAHETAQELVRLNNVVATPHTAFYTDQAIKNLADVIVENVRAYISGNPQNVVNQVAAK